jgi:hypothetical protein
MSHKIRIAATIKIILGLESEELLLPVKVISFNDAKPLKTPPISEKIDIKIRNKIQNMCLNF